MTIGPASPLAVIAAALLCALAVAVCTTPVLRALPEPADPDGKPLYATLPTPRFRACVACAAGAASAVVFTAARPSHWLAWAALALVGGLAIAVDAATTWIPRQLTTTLAVSVSLGLLVWATLDADPYVLLWAALGALGFRGFFYAFYLPATGIGFADVRLMTWVGALTAPCGLTAALTAALAGTVLGALWGLAHRIKHGVGPFAFGPGLWAGAFVALALTSH